MFVALRSDTRFVMLPDSIMPFVSLRLTPTMYDGPDFDFPQYVRKIESLSGSKVTKWVRCWEERNKFGEATHGHYHMNLYCEGDVKKDTLQKWIRRKGIVGNKAYAISIIENPEDVNLWWRYCLKEDDRPVTFEDDNSYEFGVPTDWDVIGSFAKDQREIQIKANLKLRQKLMDKNKFRTLLFKHLEEKFPDEREIRPIIKKIWLYYQSQGNSPPGNKMLDIAWDYLTESGRRTIDEWMDHKYGPE